MTTDENPSKEKMDKVAKIDLLARAMGWEILTVNYFGEDETPRQVELKDWLDRVGIESVGIYYVDVEKDFWIPATNMWGDAWDPFKHGDDTLDLIRKFQVWVSPLNETSWSATIDNKYFWIERDIQEAVCYCVLSAIEKGRISLTT